MFSTVALYNPVPSSDLTTNGTDPQTPHMIPITGGVGGASGTTAGSAPVPETFAYLTPEALLQYCESRLQGIDTQINAGVAEQNRVNQDQQTLESVASTLAKYAGGANDSQSVAEIEKAINDAISSIKRGDKTCPALADLEKLQSDIQAAGSGGKMDDKTVQGFSTALSNAVSTLNSGAELDMINLQSLMSQRQSAVEMTTNMVQTIGATLEKVVGNIGH